MIHNPLEILMRGCTILDGVLSKHGFNKQEITSGKGSGGYYAETSYTNGSRKLELHYRWSLGLVTYHFGSITLDHEAYMHALLGSNGGNKYPGFSDDPLEQFRSLVHDIEKFALAFLVGDEVEFGRCAELARKHASLSGFERLVKGEG
jgi:hypothetical protein